MVRKSDLVQAMQMTNGSSVEFHSSREAMSGEDPIVVELVTLDEARNLREYDTVLAQYIPHPTNRAILVGGEDRGFRVGMVFLVMTKDLTEIKDPTTGEVLDTYQMPIAEFEIIEVRPRISVCRGTRSHQIEGYPNLEPGYPAVCQLYAEPWE